MEELNKSNIILESGTNEIGIMEFTIAGQIYGINVSKVREIMMYSNVNPMQRSHPYVEGVFKPRDTLMTVINLPKYLNLPESANKEKDIFIIADFNNMRVAFHVNTVVGIERMSWENISKPDSTIYGGTEGVATGIAEFEGRLITILDFEKIVADISPDNSIKISDLDSLGERKRVNYPILIAEDSMLLSKLIVDSLHKAGYSNVIKTNNGKEAWNYLCELKEHGEIHNHVSCIITDIEMPQMDGHRLTKLIKEDNELKQIPVIIFSSLINEEMKHKGDNLGADEQISKPEISKLVTIIDRLVQ
ncbi:chemotaxis protein CheV [Sedimentibacter sp. zth1]|uniref:chemotaxis protein n=1 Tax=Sedimentibacter sp. zth1 TaxID=2816908 RepID=UPI001A92FE76|nr:chemotaxis protein [Sedimentibacter sp. zth1]QSX05505.1 chemotaxis protein CheV [Sedimentibacter sp. zth1]